MAASASVIFSGIGARYFAGIETNSAQPSIRVENPTTRVPTPGPDPSTAAISTTPAISHPICILLSVVFFARFNSPLFIEKALTRTSASLENGLRNLISLTLTTCVLPGDATTARILVSGNILLFLFFNFSQDCTFINYSLKR